MCSILGIHAVCSFMVLEVNRLLGCYNRNPTFFPPTIRGDSDENTATLYPNKLSGEKRQHPRVTTLPSVQCHKVLRKIVTEIFKKKYYVKAEDQT